MPQQRPVVESDARSARGRRTRERVLAAASNLFAERGFDATSVEAVADGAGITVPGMYRYFPTKHDLIVAVARWATDASQARRVVADSTDQASALAGLFDEYLAEGSAERRRLSIELSRASFSNGDVRRELADLNASLRRQLTTNIVDANPSIGSDEAARLSHLFLVLLMGAIHLDTLDPSRIGDPELIDFLREAFDRILHDPGRTVAEHPLPTTLHHSVAAAEPADGRRARSVRTRRRILAAAEELFALHGFDATTTTMIAEAAGLSVPGMYRHVESKEALLLDVARSAFTRYRVGDAPEDGPGTSAQLADLLASFSRRGDVVSRRLAVELDFGAWRSDALAAEVRGFHRRVRANVVAVVGAERGADDPASLDLAALVLLMLFMGVAHLDTLDPSLIDDPAWTDLLRRRVPQLLG